jgi:hypothetical protein
MKIDYVDYVRRFENELEEVEKTVKLMMNSNGIYESDVRITYIANALVRSGYVVFGKEWVKYETMKHVNSCKIMEIIIKYVNSFNS